MRLDHASLLALLVLALAACAPAAAPASQAAPTQQIVPAQATAAQAQSQPLATVVAPPQPVIASDFTPSDPAQVRLAAGRPQLVEFFAFW